MKKKPTVKPDYNKDENVLFRTVEASAEFSEDSKPFIVVNKNNGDYGKLMELNKNYGGFQNVPEDQNIPCKFLRYRKAENEFLLDEYCELSSIQVRRIELSVEGFQ